MFQASCLTQEDIAAHLKRIRADFCKQNWRDSLANFFPQAPGSRTVHIRAVNPVAVHELVDADQPLCTTQIMSIVRAAMQEKLDHLHDEIEQRYPRIKVANPFYLESTEVTAAG